MFEVTIFPSPSSAHLSQAFAGLYELEAAGLVELRASVDAPQWGDASTYNLQWMEISDSRTTKPRRVVVDVRDGTAIDASALAQADIYFKRSCDCSELARLPESLRRKVRPYGLNYACSSDNQPRNLTFARQLYGIERIDSERPADVLKPLRRRASLPLRWLGLRRDENSANEPLPFTRFEADAASFAQPAVLFLTRLWSPQATPGSDPCALKELNATRIELIRTLRDRFGERFVGGVQRDRYSERLCPDCVTDAGTNKAHYLELMKSHLIAIASTGLHGSTGWKFAEYVAASRCIVSEPLRSTLPEPLVQGVHYLEYHTPEQCADACDRILDDPALANAMRRDNQEYYRRALKPCALMLRHLQCATMVGAG
jgi:hypothetical protein